MRHEHHLKTAVPMIGFILLAATVAPARTLDLPPGKWWEIPRLVDYIKLSPEQQAQIEERVYEHAQRMIDLNAGVERTKLALERLVGREVIDPDTVRKAFADFQEARRNLESERFEMLLAVRQILTSEQWDRLAGLRDRLEQGRQRRPGEHPRQQDRRPPGGVPGQNGFSGRPN